MTTVFKSTRSIAQRLGGRTQTMALRAFSNECQAARKVRDAIAEYRERNYTMEVPSRFKKELILPYTTSNGTIDVEQLNKLLVNIGYSDSCLSSKEQIELLRDAGCSGREFSKQQFMELLD
mmetsp:Transcript_1625/g.2497  ORF Transcript_1625/g.2497 Transcript_1625/m.2497 type:complete len:121 (+) Transcript_1625:56-418(+)